VARAPAGARNDQRKHATVVAYLSWCWGQGMGAVPFVFANVGGFLVAWVQGLRGSTASIHTKLSHLKTSGDVRGIEWMVQSDRMLLSELIKDLEYADVRASGRKDPLRGREILRIVASKDLRRWSDLLDAIMLTTCYRGALRSGELTGGLVAADVVWDDDGEGFRLLLLRTKTHRKGAAIDVHIREDDTEFSAVKLMRRWFNRNGLWEYRTRQLFPWFEPGTGGKMGQLDWARPRTYEQFVKMIKSEVGRLGLDPARYAGHSLRAGIATDMFASGRMTPAQIMRFGRWKSLMACMIYFRETSEVTDLVSSVVASMIMRS
jgi:hypothetical protein